MNHQFAGILYRTHADMISAIAHEWASAGGNKAHLAESLQTQSDEALAADCIASWELDQGDDFDETPSHMAAEGYTATDLAAAFRELRQ
jgi:hypothetical protein